MPPAAGANSAVTVTTVLGDLVRENGPWNTCSGEADGVVVTLELSSDEPEQVAALADRVHRIIGERAAFVRRVRAEVAAVFGPGAGRVDIWQGEDGGGGGECRISAGEFARRIRLGGVTAHDDDFDGIELWFDDNDMFGQHAIQVQFDEAGNLVDAKL